MQDIIPIQLHIEHARQGTYFSVPFSVPEGVESIHIRYAYTRRESIPNALPNGNFIATPEVNIIDIGLIAPDGNQVGFSGSDKLDFEVSEERATPGYRPTRITAGEWRIMVGAYHVLPQGVDVEYIITLTHKRLRLLKGDLHTHTVASDGVHTAEELAWKARANGLDFVVVTDHNLPAAKNALPRVPGVTLIPGVEWTHYQGHANFMGVDQPYDEPFATNTPGEAASRFRSARERGALIMLNHPFDTYCRFQFDLASLPFDAIEVWNGPMRETNLMAVGLWQKLLAAGKKIPAWGGSDYHRDTLFVFLGGPTSCVYAQSNGASDILAALKTGHGYIAFAPNAPVLEMTAGDAIMGDSVAWAEVRALNVKVTGLQKGDVLRLATGMKTEAVFQAPEDGDYGATFPMDAPGFARVEVLRAFLPGLPMLPALLSNPIYFDGV